MSFNLMHSMKGRIFALVVLLLISALAISLFIFSQAIAVVEDERFENDLENARNTVEIYLTERKEQFRNTQGAFSRAFVTSTLFLPGDLPTVGTANSFMASLISRSRADLMMAISLEGRVLGQILRKPVEGEIARSRLVPGPESNAPFQLSLESAELSQGKDLVYFLDGDYYQFTLSKISDKTQPMVWVGYGYLLNNQLAEQLHRDYTNNIHVDFLLIDSAGLDCRLVASSRDSIQKMLSASDDIACNTDMTDFQQAPESIMIGNLDELEYRAVVYGSRSTLISTVTERLEIFSTFLVIVLLASLIGVYLIASIISKPVQLLAQKARIVAGGKYDEPVEVKDSGELGQLATEFNNMQQAVLEREQAIRYQSAHDPLTDLPNRTSLFELLNNWYQESRRGHAMLLIKVDHIKEINESLGHETGDSVIKVVSDRLRTLEGAELLSHLRTDEFVLLVKAPSKSSVLQWIDLVTKLVESPCSTRGMTLHLAVHIGIALDNEGNIKPGTFLRMADSALQMARKQKAPYSLYDPSLDQEQTERLELMNELRTAIEENQLLLHYQPKLNPRTNRVDKVEALVRWQHPERGMVRPDKFISIAENSGQINALTNWVMEEAARQHLEWKEIGLDIAIAVNISAENLKNESFYESVLFVIEQYKIDISALSLEVTESAVVEDPESAIEILSQLKQRGFHLSIDDYGTGYSSLAQLKQLPVHELKIDMSFIKRLPDDEDDKIIVQSTIELAHNMGLTVVAEGVETQEGLDWLTENHCDLMQGYHISRPLSGEDFASWYKASSYPD